MRKLTLRDLQTKHDGVLPPDAVLAEPEGSTPPAPAVNRRGPGPGAGRFGTLNAFVDATVAGLKRSELVVWLVLFRDTKANGLARTSQADIARRGGLSERMVRYALQKLAAAGLVRVVSSGRLRDRASVYRVTALGN